jgi:sugar diacid utilization regulator
MKQRTHKMIDFDFRGFKGTTQTVLELFQHLAKQEGWTSEEIQTVISEATKHDDESHLIETIIEYCKY